MPTREVIYSLPCSFYTCTVDGIFPCKERCVVAALAIDTGGNKHLLDFEEGSSESAEVVKGLFARLHARGLKAGTARRLLMVRDGSEAIAKAVRHFWPDAVQQECLMHVERGLIDKVCRWNEKTDQLSRWTGVALLRPQEGFRRVRGHRELGELATALGRTGEQSELARETGFSYRMSISQPAEILTI